MLHMIKNTELSKGSLIAQGQYSTIYQGVWNGHKVAIKELQLSHKKGQGNTWKEFREEALTMSYLVNPSVTRLYGLCLDKGKYQIILEYLPKGDLQKLLANKREALPWDQKWQIAIDIAVGIRYLHQKKIIHRDLTSQNVLIDENYHAKICDFGLRKIKIQTETTLDLTKFTSKSLHLTAPELLQYPPSLTVKSDIYSLGFILWELVTRLKPFPTATTTKQIINSNKKPQIPQNCPKLLANLINSCWVQNYKKRPTDDQVLQQLKNMHQQFMQDKQKNIAPNQSNLQKICSKGIDQYKKKNYAAAFSSFQLAANKNHPEALYRMALCYERGHGRVQNLKAAHTHLIQAADLGHSKAQFIVGVRYYNGKDYTPAVKYLYLATKQKTPNPLAQYHLGMCYLNDWGVQQNFPTAVSYLQPAADKQLPQACYQLAKCYELGKGVKQDATLAIKYYRISAEILAKKQL